MEINELAALGHGLATVMFASLTVLMLSRWKNRPKAAFIALAAAASTIWAAVQAVGSLGYLNAPAVLLIVEWIRSLAWLTVLASILRELDEDRQALRLVSRYGVFFLLACGALTINYAMHTSDTAVMIGVVGGGVTLSALILIIAEQVYRNAPYDSRSGIKYFCVGLAGIYTYDLVIFALTIVNKEMDVDQWATRGFVNFFFAVPLGFAARRSFRLSLDRYMPRQFLFYSFALMGIGTFIILTLIGDYYVNRYGGTWAGVGRIILMAMAVVFVAVLLVSRTVRARVRVFLMKSFFQYKYDYRKEWLRFIGTLTESELGNVSSAAVRAVAQIVNSPGGIVWVQEEDGKDYYPLGSWQSDIPVISTIGMQSSLIRFLRQRQWVIDLNEVRAFPARYEGLELDPWVREHKEWWLIVPLFLQNSLFGFIVLEKPGIVPTLNFEDHDLLRTVGRHVATHIDQAESDRRLAESSQFGTYNRLTAFLMHDLNNLIAQQSLVVKNAEKYRHNPDFVDDAISTIAHSVSRMRRLMEQLTSESEQAPVRDVQLQAVIEKAVKRSELRKPKPALESDGRSFIVSADAERLTAAVEHLIRNAQDATNDDGQIDVRISGKDSIAVISIADNGCGMSPEFVRERLFRPFDSTKGSQSMGIGAYQAREYIRQLGGQLDVTSTPGQGTRFDIRLPTR
jgi:putative PEP-CTERM system histidine kinase